MGRMETGSVVSIRFKSRPVIREQLDGYLPFRSEDPVSIRFRSRPIIGHRCFISHVVQPQTGVVFQSALGRGKASQSRARDGRLCVRDKAVVVDAKALAVCDRGFAGAARGKETIYLQMGRMASGFCRLDLTIPRLPSGVFGEN